MREDDGYGAGSVLLSFLLGGLVGAGFALLLAPQSGRETRQKIRELSGEAKEKAVEYVGDIKGKVSSNIEKGKGYYEEKKSMISSAFEAGKDAYGKEKERLSKEPNA